MINQPSPELIIQSFAVPKGMTKIYQGQIPQVQKDISEIRSRMFSNNYVFSNLQFEPITKDGLTITHLGIDTALFSVNQSKNVVRTPINGRDGQIKEFTGMDDYIINIKGVICGSNGNFPKTEVQNLRDFLVYDQSIGIISSYLNDIFGIYEVVIYDFRLPQDEGGISTQKFEIDCYSDKPVEILISEAQQ